MNPAVKILAIETSCDETAIAVLEIQEPPHQNKFGAGPRFSILANLVASQVKIHAPFGGVVPNLAIESRGHTARCEYFAAWKIAWGV